MKKFLKFIRVLVAVILILAAAAATAVLAANLRVVSVGKSKTLSAEEAEKLEGVDCIIVLGCQVKADGSLSDMLHDRLERAVELYRGGAAPKLLMSGDHGTKDYDEVGAMKRFAVGEGVPSGDVFMDHAGFSTYETVYRAKEVFKAEKVIIVTQSYHLYRALYIAERLGLEAYGVASDLHDYGGQRMRDVREVLARTKDFGMCIVKPLPTYLGEAIPISGSGDLTEG